MKRMHLGAGVVFALVFAVGVFGGRLFDGPDYQALCKAQCACTGCEIGACVENYARLGEEQGECREAGDAVAACKLEPGGAKCDRGGGWTLYMPTENCRAQLDAFGACLETRAEAKMSEAKRVFEAGRPKLSYVEALRVLCEAPEKIDVDVDGAEPSQRASELARYVEANASNAQFEALMERVASAPGPQKERLLREALQAEGIGECAFLDHPSPR